MSFQIWFFHKFDNLSVWPRYFVIHYFFLTWLLALAFNHLCALNSNVTVATWPRRGITTVIGAIVVVMLTSGVFQVRSYYRDPFFDTGLTPASNWNAVAAELSRVLQPTDVILIYDYTSRATLTFTRPMNNRIILFSDLENGDLDSIPRLMYLESRYALAEREALTARLERSGLKPTQHIKLYSTDRKTLLNDWEFLVFDRHSSPL